MKTALIVFKDESSSKTEEIKKITDCFLSFGINVETIVSLSFNDDLLFFRQFNELKNIVDNLIILNNKEITFNLDESICRALDTELVENELASDIIDSYGSYEGSSVKELAFMPMDATVIPNNYGFEQGYLVEDNDFSLIVIPETDNYIKMFEEYVAPYYNKKYGIEKQRNILKFFCIDKKRIDRVIQNAKLINKNISLEYSYLNGDVTLTVVYQKEQSESAYKLLNQLKIELQDLLYAEVDYSLEQTVFDLLKEKNKKISVAESFTSGRVSSSIISISGASEFFYEGIVAYSNESKIDRLGVKEQTLKEKGAVSTETAYEMAVGLLLKGESDIVVSTTGIAGPNSDGDKPVGLGYIAVGTMQGVHVYKNLFNGDRKTITETAKNTALFLVIQNLKKL
ncbi:MAG: nicotinamide-nucleotide amidohydrolase family protein [Clostridia bacterium]|nr:nicotinamide-nucleotide amidohydrolase family protein [Clostridia bacterium]